MSRATKTRLLAAGLILALVTTMLIPLPVAQAATNTSPSSAFNKAYITSFNTGVVDVVNLTDNTVEKGKIRVGTEPNSAAINPNGTQVFITNRADDSVSVIDPATDTVIAEISVGRMPHGVAFSSDGSKAYVANYNGDSLSVIDTRTLTVTRTIEGMSSPVAMVVIGDTLYTTQQNANKVCLIDINQDTIIGEIPVGMSPYGLSANPQGDKIYVANQATNTVSVINTESHTVEATIAVGMDPSATEVSPDGRTVYVVNSSDNSLSVIDAAANTVTDTIAVSGSPFVVGVSADGSRAYTVNYDSDNMSVIDTNAKRVIDVISLSSGPFMVGTFMIPTAVASIKPVVDVSIALSDSSISIDTGQSETVTAVVTKSDGSTQDVTHTASWTSSDSSVASVSNGKIVANGIGEADITARTAGGLTASVHVSVHGVESLYLSYPSLNLQLGESRQALAQSVYSYDQSISDVTAYAVWTTEDAEIASVNNGYISAVNPGTTVITATYGGKSATIPVSVMDVQLTGLTVTPDSVTMNVRDTQATVVTATYSDRSSDVVTNLVTWSSSNESIASVNTGVITANSEGTASITGTLDGFSVTIAVTVNSNNPGDTSGSNPGDNPGDTSGSNPGDNPGDTSGSSPGDNPGDTSGSNPGDNPGDTPGSNPGDNPGDTSGSNPGDNPGDTSGSNPGDNPGDTSGSNPGDNPGDTTGSNPGDSSGDNPGDTPGSNPGDNPGDTSGSNPGDSSGNTSGSNSGNSSESSSDSVSGVGTVPEPNEPKVDIFNRNVFGVDGNVVSHIQLMVERAQKGATTIVQLSDISEHWADETIRRFIRLGIITGYKDHTFKPNAEITRSEFAAIISRVFNIQGSSNPVVLTDISENWAKNEIERLASIGLITGYGDGSFRPNAPISREEMAVILARVVNLSQASMDDSKGQFTDLSTSYAADEIRDAAKAGIITGRGDGRFGPKNKATRAEALQIINNVLNLNPQIQELLGQLN